MGIFSKSTSSKDAADTPKDTKEPKPSFYQRYQSSKRGEIRDEDLQKYLGKSKAEINAWAENEPGVGKNQLAGKIDQGETSGLGGVAAADGYGGWGWSAGGSGKDRGLKFPPEKADGKKIDGDGKT